MNAPLVPNEREGMLAFLERARPVPSLAGDDRVESPTVGVPLFELRHLDFEPVAAGKLGHPGAHLDTKHPVSGCLERPGGNTRTDTDIQQVKSRAVGDDPLNHGLGVAGSGAVVALGPGPNDSAICRARCDSLAAKAFGSAGRVALGPL